MLSKSLLVYLFLLCCFHTRAQLSVRFTPAVYGQTIEGLFFAQISSALPAEIRVVLSVEVTGRDRQQVAKLVTPAFNIRPGLHALDRALFSAGRFSFGANSAGRIARESGRFPEGEYDYCYELEVVDNKGLTVSPVFEQCFTHQLQPLTPLLLIHPADRDESCNKRPNFMWQPPLPLPAGARSRLVLTPVRQGQDVAEALAYNLPLINQPHIITNNLNYPVSVPELKEGAVYAWQVTVYMDKAILKKSEIWTFTVKCGEPKKENIDDSYRELKEILNAQVHYAYGKLRFFFSNPYNEGKLNYKIYPLSQKQVAMERLPQLDLVHGYNQFDIDLSDIRGFADGKEYLMKVWLADGKILQLRFMYKEWQ